MSSSSQLISIKQAASMLGVTPLTLRNWDKNGKLCPMRHPINNYRVYKRSDIEALIERMDASAHAVRPNVSTAHPSYTRTSSKTVTKLRVRHLED